ncbi:hypothetical protein Gohar_005031 [Gossypium harknessii]|uniref:Uncharacterized protein n=1 Tax=Gossypium harknessii TaxID=34285 RepID=A0A7J9H718_9ROSI|nr:hypothetical protein [Gossypium harknessii]
MLMNLTQLQLNNLSVAKDVSKAFGPLLALTLIIIPTGATQDRQRHDVDEHCRVSDLHPQLPVQPSSSPLHLKRVALPSSSTYALPYSPMTLLDSSSCSSSSLLLVGAWSCSTLTWSDSNRYWKRETTSTAEERKVIIEKTKVAAFATAEEATTLVEKFKDTG